VRKEAAFRIISVMIGLGAILIALEVGLRVLPTTSVALRLPVDAAHPIARFPADMAWRSSVGWDFKSPVEGRTNNAGFVHAEPYSAHGPRPLVAIVGDSFVEAMTVRHQDSLQGRLTAAIGGRGRVYSFGMSGAPLSQYLAWADHAARHYRPDLLVVPIIANDFDESLLAYKMAKGGHLYGGFHYYEQAPDGQLVLRLVPYTPSRMVAVLRASALARYLVFHLKAHKLRLADLTAALFGRDTAVAKVSPAEARLRRIFEPAFFESWPERQELAQRATLAFLDALPQRARLAPAQIILAVDGLRTAILLPQLDAQAKASFFGRMRTFFTVEARKRGYRVVDLDQAFRAHVAKTAQRVEFAHDYHWNAAGYGVAAREITMTAPWQSLFGAPRTTTGQR